MINPTVFIDTMEITGDCTVIFKVGGSKLIIIDRGVPSGVRSEEDMGIIIQVIWARLRLVQIAETIADRQRNLVAFRGSDELGTTLLTSGDIVHIQTKSTELTTGMDRFAFAEVGILMENANDVAGRGFNLGGNSANR